jgi:hemerythrin superfamily protein
MTAIEDEMAQTQQTGKGATPDAQSGTEAGSTKSVGTKHAPNDAEQNPITMLKSDHRKVEGLFNSFESASSPQKKTQLAKQICTELMIHTLLEEEIFYPACKGHMEERLLNEAQVEHDSAKMLIIELQSDSPHDQYYDAKVNILSEEIKHHIAEEERPTSGIFAQAEQANVNTQHLASQLRDRKQELTEKAKAGGLGSPEPRSFRIQTHVGMKQSLEENPMARNSTSTLERDDRGRFVSDDDDRRYSRPRDEEGRFTSARSRSRYDDDDERRHARPRDEEGRFTSSRSHSRYDDDDDERRGGRGHGGWYGDPRGHSEAARRGWDEREGSTRSRYRDEDERRSSRYDDDDDERRYPRPRDEEGRFTSSRSSSRYDDEDEERRGDRGHGGWYGDPRRHSQAARRRLG